MTQPDPQTLNNLSELTYSKWTAHYNQKNWIYNLPIWSQLTEEDQEFWKEFVKNIRSGFKSPNNIKDNGTQTS